VPDQAAGASAAYGSDGACWKTQTHDVCEQGCTSGFDALHKLNPSMCPLCASDADCSGSTPACDPKAGECVGCVTNAHCSGGLVCDSAAQRCVQCVGDGDCSGNLAACDTSQHVCVACNLGSQCVSNRCESDHTCCKPNTYTCMAVGSCGPFDDGCGNQVNCGTCNVGTCDVGRCSTEGNKCTPGTNTCAQGESCMFDAISQGYLCHVPDHAPELSDRPCSDTLGYPYCEANNMSSSARYYVCTVDTMAPCVQLCLTPQDCIGGGPCSPFFDKTIISAMKPGYCHS
jgi:hypothetical protein